MSSAPRHLALVLLAGLSTSACAGAPRAEPAPSRPATGSVERGRIVYRRACATCHGASGDGRGPGAAGLAPEPRDFSRGVFRYRSTPSGSLPLDADIERTIRVGAPGTAMPAFRDLLTRQDIADVVAFVKSTSPRFEKEEVEEPVALSPAPPPSAESAARGERAYAKAQCAKCHGERGKGDGWAKADEMKDDQGRTLRARDFTKGIYRSGNRREDLLRTLVTGLDGTPMPSYEGSLSPAELHDLVSYLISLERDRGVWFWLTTPPRWYEPSEQRVIR